MSSNTNQNIYPKSCLYNCGIQIFWNTATSEYWEVFTKKKHICPNRVKKPVTSSNTSATVGVSSKPINYNKKPWFTTPKQKMSNSFELLTGPIDAIQRNMRLYLIWCQNLMGRFMVHKGIEILKQASLICWCIMKFL